MFVLLFLIKHYGAVDINCGPCLCINNNKGDGRFANCSIKATAGSLVKIPSGLGVVQKLDLNGQPLEGLKEDAFVNVGLVNLEIIVLENCNIRHLSENAFRKIITLRSVTLARNKLNHVNTATFSDNNKINYINLSDNKLKTIDLDAFKNLHYLRTLDLSFNSLSVVENRLRSGYIEIIRLNNNNLTTLDASQFGNVRNLRELTLHKNSWKCNCRLLPIFEFSQNLTKFGLETTCDSPRRLQYRPWGNLKPSDFDCSPTVTITPNNDITSAYSGNNVTLSCQVISEFNIDVFWLRKTERIRTSYIYHVVEGIDGRNVYWSNMTIINITTGQEGLYR